ncbi:MAG TPA: VWA domain-containing protein [Candidatus Limnocylindria bacterium]|nr:VWA domain-containing protein [Candidatus Limnocylindria bacterium]
MSTIDSPAVELAPIREMLRLYCHALAERSVDLQDLKQLIDKNIGWSKNDVATSDGAAIFLPAVVERFEAQADNYDFLKVMLTQQAGHIEFGSFEFEFDRPATRFHDLRAKVQAPLDYHDHDHGHEGHHENPGVTELTRFFKLFPNKRLALDIFSIVESARVEAHILLEYPGIAASYRAMRRRTMELRQEIVLLPAREALLEFLIRLSLGQTGGTRVPRKHLKVAQELRTMLGLIGERGATVEDAAEATLRIYARLAKIKNDYLQEDEFANLEEGESSSRSNRSNRSGRGKSSNRSNGSSGSKRRVDDDRHDEKMTLPPLVGREREYLSPQGVDYRGDFRPELAQLLTQPQANSREQRKSLTAEELADLIRSQRAPKPRDSEEEGEEQDPQTAQMVHNLMRELERRDPRMQSVSRRPSQQSDDDTGPLTASQPNTYVYDEWNVFDNTYRSHWCKVYEKVMPMGDLNFYRETLLGHAGLLQQIRREFEQVTPEIYHKEKRLPDGTDHDLDAAIEAMIDLRLGVSPSEKIFWRHHKIERDVTVAFLLDMSGSTGEAIRTVMGDGRAAVTINQVPAERQQRRIIDVEKEAIVLMMDALEAIGDRYAVYGFSGHGRDNVEFYVIKDIGEEFNLDIAKRFGRIGPLHATRMGPAIRHATAKMRHEQTRSKFLFLISDGRPQDRGYSQDGSEKAYAVQDTRMALIEARREGIHPFCLTVDKEGNDYLRTMMDDFSYEVLADVNLLPHRLPQLYKRLTF